MKGKENISTEELQVSRSQRRREALEVKSLATELIKLSPARLGRVPLDEQVRSAVMEARQIRSNVAHKRQMQYVAKLLRRIDLEEIIQTLEGFDNEGRHLAGRQHRTEAWRDYLLEAGDPAAGALFEQRSDTDTQTIRQLVRNARKEAANGKPPSSARTLFRVLREMDEVEPLPPTGGS